MPTFAENMKAAQAQYNALAAENAALKKAQGTTPVPAPAPAPQPAPVPPAAPTEPTLGTAPQFGIGPYTAGKPITRIIGEYPGSTPTAGRRYRDNQLIEGATGASYVIAQADVGKMLVYEEEATHNESGAKKWFRSLPVVGEPATTAPGGGEADGVWTAADVEDAIQSSVGTPNEGRILNANNGSPGWLSGGVMCFGNEWRNLDRWWDWETSGRDDYFWFEYLEWWAVLFVEEGSSGDGWVEIKNMEFQILYKGENRWQRLAPMQQEIAWSENYSPRGNQYDTGFGATQTRPGSDGGQALLVPHGKSPHFTAGSRHRVPRVDQIDGVLCTMLARRDPRDTNGNFKGLVQVGGDPKPSPSPNTDGVTGAYLPFAVSQTRRVTPQWRRITCSNVVSPTADMPNHPGYSRRTMSRERFLAVRPVV